MMAGSMELARLCVEGTDDEHSIGHLLLRHGVGCDPDPRFPEIEQSGSVEQLLSGIVQNIQLSTDRPVGFVLDADSPLDSRWQAVRDRLKQADVDSPKTPPADGFVGDSPKYKTRVGVWLMPDNQQDGKLETFLKTLIDENDPLIGHAESATDAAKQLADTFSDRDQIKAVVHTWLAWQKEPGNPYGTAIRARYFQHASPAAVAFVAWFKRLYGIA